MIGDDVSDIWAFLFCCMIWIEVPISLDHLLFLGPILIKEIVLLDDLLPQKPHSLLVTHHILDHQGERVECDDVTLEIPKNDLLYSKTNKSKQEPSD
jgi:hypothetical protein